MAYSNIPLKIEFEIESYKKNIYPSGALTAGYNFWNYVIFIKTREIFNTLSNYIRTQILHFFTKSAPFQSVQDTLHLFFKSALFFRKKCSHTTQPRCTIKKVYNFKNFTVISLFLNKSLVLLLLVSKH